MSVRIVAIGPRGHKTYEIRWKNGELYDYHDTRAGAVRKAARARREEKEYYRPQKNPSKLQRALMAQKKRTERRVADALAKYLKVQNPGQKVTSAKIQRLKGGVIKITPLQNNPTKRTVSFADVRDGHGWALRYSGSDSPYGNYTDLPMNSKDQALMLAKLERESAKKRFGTLKNYRIRVVKV